MGRSRSVHRPYPDGTHRRVRWIMSLATVDGAAMPPSRLAAGRHVEFTVAREADERIHPTGATAWKEWHREYIEESATYQWMTVAKDWPLHRV